MSSNSSTGLGQWLAQIHTYGFSFIPSTPPNATATSSLLERISFIRPTHYGGFWSFTSSANPIDTAYTTLGLPVHTDTTYFTDPAGLQLFHLLSHSNGSGGASTFVDGFAAAQYLHDLDPSAYEVLSRVRIISHASGAGEAGSFDNTAASDGYPVFVHAPPISTQSESPPHPSCLRQIRWNNDDRSARTKWADSETMEKWYQAASKWDKILRMKEFEIEVQLQPGTPVIFDNWRMLHGRRAFTGDRTVCGGYIGMDDFLAKLRLLNGRDTAEGRNRIVDEEHGKGVGKRGGSLESD